MGVDRSIPSLDLYRELEVDTKASTEAIEAAYRTLMKRHHPDLAGPEGLARAKRLNVARDWLVDRDRRARYDAAQESRRTAALGATTRPATTRPAGPAPGTAPARRPSARTANQAHPLWTARTPPAAIGLGSVAVVALVAASLVLGWGPSAAGGAGPSALAPALVATPEPTPQPTPDATPTPTVTLAPAPTPVATPATKPRSTSRPSSAPGGHADIRFSGMYTEHYDQALDGASACSTSTGPGGSASTLTGFQVDSAAHSPMRWELTLADLTVSWSMDIFFEDTADGLWWNSGVGVGSVSRTTDGFRFDVVMTDADRSIRAIGTVSCR